MTWIQVQDALQVQWLKMDKRKSGQAGHCSGNSDKAIYSRSHTLPLLAHSCPSPLEMEVGAKASALVSITKSKEGGL